jgi:hypothetical protein
MILALESVFFRFISGFLPDLKAACAVVYALKKPLRGTREFYHWP